MDESVDEEVGLVSVPVEVALLGREELVDGTAEEL